MKYAVLYHYLIIYIVILIHTFIKINAKNREVKKAPLKLQSGTAVSTLRAEPRQDLAAFAAIVRTTSFTITAMRN